MLPSCIRKSASNSAPSRVINPPPGKLCTVQGTRQCSVELTYYAGNLCDTLYTLLVAQILRTSQVPQQLLRPILTNAVLFLLKYVFILPLLNKFQGNIFPKSMARCLGKTFSTGYSFLRVFTRIQFKTNTTIMTIKENRQFVQFLSTLLFNLKVNFQFYINALKHVVK